MNYYINKPLNFSFYTTRSRGNTPGSQIFHGVEKPVVLHASSICLKSATL